MNVVQVILAGDKNKNRYTYKVPNNLQLKKGDIVCTKNTNESVIKECIATCSTDSENLTDNTIDMIMSGGGSYR